MEVRERSPDGTHPLPFGPFKARIRVTCEDDTMEPILCLVYGRLRGDVYIKGDTAAGMLRFSNFDASKGTGSQSVTLQSDVPDLELEVDTERTKPYVQVVEFKKLEDGKRWLLRAKIAPNKALGPVPREDDDYFDSAIYVKTKGNATRSLRIPVEGEAATR